jgi:hypothetical protein
MEQCNRITMKNLSDYTNKKIIPTLSAIGELGISFEGQGGKKAYYDDDYEVGTGLRAPSMPLYNTPIKIRHRVLLELESQGCINIKNKEDAFEWTGLTITPQGIRRLRVEVCDNCHTHKDWYHTVHYQQTGPHSGIKTEGLSHLCECAIKEFEERNKQSGSVRSSSGSGIRGKAENKLMKELNKGGE